MNNMQGGGGFINQHQTYMTNFLQQANYVNDPMSALQSATSVFIKQAVNWSELVTGYESPNRYQVYYRNQNQNYTMLFACKEMSGCCERQYCSGRHRPFMMNVMPFTNMNMPTDFTTNVFAVMHKPFKCTCLCCCRPEMTGSYGSGGNVFGKIYEPYTCCDPVFQVLDNAGNVKYSITTNCCNCGYCCRDSCGVFSGLSFSIFKGEFADSNKPELAVGILNKYSCGIQSLLTDTNNFEIKFPVDANVDERMALIATALMIDYMFFEEAFEKNRNDNNNF